MKLAIVVPDGMADRPDEFDGGATPLEAAEAPEMDTLAREGILGRVITVPDSVPPGSDAAITAVLGLDPREYAAGRAALEAAGRGVELGDDEIAFRMNLITIRNGIMADYSAGGIATEEARPLVEAVASALEAEDVKVHAGVSYRHLAVVGGLTPEDLGKIESLRCTPPHDIQGEPEVGYRPQGDGAEALTALMARANAALRERAGSNSAANAVWLWGQGRRATLPALAERFGVSGTVISAVDLVRGIGRSMGMDVIEVEGATGDLDTDYAGKGEAAAKAMEKYGIVLVHVEAPDEASHRGDAEGKRSAIESVDREVVSRVRRAAAELTRKGQDARVLVLPDHLTPLSIRTHAHGAVPFALAGPGMEPDDASSMGERAAASSGMMIERGWELLAFALGEKARADADKRG
jgi:2,3-bisphosphoglycerate-independent phosphoglycerate mutase